MEYNIYPKINELEELKERKKILRQIRQSKEKLLTENPQAIIPFLKYKLNDSFLRNSYQYPPHNQPSPIESRVSIPTPIQKTTKRDKEIIEILALQKNTIENELEQIRLSEERNRRNLNDRFEQLIQNQEIKTEKALGEIKTYFKLLNQNQLDIQSYRKENADVLTELKILKNQYLMDGGTDRNILQDIDNSIKEAEKFIFKKTEIDDFKWNETRKNMVMEREKSFELLELERYNAELERKLEIDRARLNYFNSTSRNSETETNKMNTIEMLQNQIHKLQEEMAELNKSRIPEYSEKVPNKQHIQTTSRNLINEDTKSFLIILDFISGIATNVKSAAVTFSIYKKENEILKPIVLKPIAIRPQRKKDLDFCIILNSNQPLFNCPVSRHTLGFIQLKMKTEYNEETNYDVWTRINIFSDKNELNEGHWQIKMYNYPMKQQINEEEFLRLPQYHNAILHYRIINSLNSFTNEVFSNSLQSSRMPTPASPVFEPELEENRMDSNDEKSDITVELNEKPEFGFQVIRVKNIAKGDGLQFGKIRLTVYYTDGPKKGLVLSSNNGPVTCCTNSVRADFKLACYQFGRQMGQFSSFDLSVDCVVYARFYLDYENAQPLTNGIENSDEIGETLVAWTAIPLVKPKRIAKNIPKHHTNSLKLLKINKGLHDIPFYELPVVAPSYIQFDNKGSVIGQKKFGKAKLKLRIFHTTPLYESATSSEEMSNDEENKNNLQPWIPVHRAEPLLSPFLQSDGIDLYIDSGRCWPDSVTISKIEGQILNGSLVSQGSKFSTYFSLSSDIFNPEFKERIEIRDSHLSPSSTLLLKIYTYDREEKSLIIFGFAALKIFVDTGTDQQPLLESADCLISLNDGGHQIRIYSSGPDENSLPFSESWFETNHIPSIPGASILLRIYKAQKNTEGKLLSIYNTPKIRHVSLGVIINPPKYEDGYYYSMSCRPNNGERHILISHIMRPRLLARDLIKSKWFEFLKEKTDLGNINNENNISKLFDNLSINKFNMNRIAHYNANYGFKIAIDGCINLPWAGFSAASLSLFPPGALYMNKPLMAFDRPFLVSNLNLNGTPLNPMWKNGWKTYKRRKFDKYLIAILHLHEIKIKSTKNDIAFSLENEAWIPIQIFDYSYCITNAIQMPLIIGAPKLLHLNELKSKSVKQFLNDNLLANKIEYLDSTSVIIRQCDSRRILELSPSLEDDTLTLDQSYIPESKLATYKSVNMSKEGSNFENMIPVGVNKESFQEMFRIKFKSLIYKFYDENGFYLK